MTNRLAIGKLSSSFGVEGGIKVKSFSGETQHFKKLTGKTILLKRDDHELSVSVERCIIKGEIPVLFFQDYPSPEKVKQLGGYEVWVDRNDASKLEQGEFYLSDLVGFEILFQQESIGTVTAFIEGATLLLEGQSRKDNKAFYIPFIDHFIGEIDWKNKQIELLNDESL